MEEKSLTKPISQEQFKEVAANLAQQRHDERMKAFREEGFLSLRNFIAVQRYRSVRRAIRRGHVSIYGDMYPNRPFNNRRRGPGTITYERRKIYEQYRNTRTE
jgi:hypothetical protein